MSNYEAVTPPPEAKGKRGRGRPKVEAANVAALYNFPGPTKQDKLHQLYEDWRGCTRCFLGEQRKIEERGDDIVFFSGNPDASILIVGEAPGEHEEEDGVPFVGPSGQLLNQMLAQVSDDPDIQNLVDWYAKISHTEDNQIIFHERVFEWRHQEYGLTNVVSCRPPENRQPSLPEMKACWERLWNIIYIVDPLVIVACGNTALNAVTRKLSAQITKVRGQIFDAEYDGKVGKVTYPVMPMLHPSFLLRTADWKEKDGYYAKTMGDWKKVHRVVDLLRLQNFGTPIPQRAP